MKKYTCFVVSPIGEKDSPTRVLADDLFDLLIEPALEKFGFSVIRADKISSVSSITSDIIEHLQNSDLCVIDITGHNPNVMYECGRRHETGKPYIMVAREGEHLPFDITTIRTFFYNLEKPREILLTKNAMQDTVERMLQDGFRTDASGDSLASVVELLRRIERKIDAMPLGKSATAAMSAPSKVAAANDLVKRLGAVDAFVYARSQGDAELIDALVPIMKKRIKNRKNFVLHGLGSAATHGSRAAFDELEAILPLDDEYTDDEKIEIISCYVSGSFKLSEADRALKTFQRLYGDLTEEAAPSSMTVEQRAQLLNQYQRMLYSLDRERDAIVVGARVLELCPNEASYLYNQALNYTTLDEVDAALPLIDKLMGKIVEDPKSRDSNHLRLAVTTYAKAKQIEKFRDAYQILVTHDEYVATVVQQEDEVQALLKGI